MPRQIGKMFFYTIDEHTQLSIGKSPDYEHPVGGWLVSGAWYYQYFIDGIAQGVQRGSLKKTCELLNISKSEAKAKFCTGYVGIRALKLR